VMSRTWKISSRDSLILTEREILTHGTNYCKCQLLPHNLSVLPQLMIVTSK
jgi:hypothetical protein